MEITQRREAWRQAGANQIGTNRVGTNLVQWRPARRSATTLHMAPASAAQQLKRHAMTARSTQRTQPCMLAVRGRARHKTLCKKSSPRSGDNARCVAPADRPCNAVLSSPSHSASTFHAPSWKRDTGSTQACGATGGDEVRSSHPLQARVSGTRPALVATTRWRCMCAPRARTRTKRR